MLSFKGGKQEDDKEKEKKMLWNLFRGRENEIQNHHLSASLRINKLKNDRVTTKNKFGYHALTRRAAAEEEAA